MAILKKYWFIVVPVVVLIGLGLYNDIIVQVQDGRDKKELVKLRSERSALEKELAIKSEKLYDQQVVIEELNARPDPEPIEKIITKVVVKKVDGKKYVPKPDFDTVVANRDELFGAYEQLRQENKELKIQIAKYFTLKALFGDPESKIITNLDSQVKTLNSVVSRLHNRLRRKWGLGIIGGYGFGFNDITRPNWFIGVGLYYKVY